jgi:Tol biopolymer transport system component
MKSTALIVSSFMLLVSGLLFEIAAQTYGIQQYLNIKSASAPTFSPDGKSIAYLTNVTGTQQVWVVDLPNGAPRQLTNYADNVGFVKWLADGSGLIFGKAKGGDENTQFYWMSRLFDITLDSFHTKVRLFSIPRISGIASFLTFTV